MLKNLNIFGQDILVRSYNCSNEKREICSHDYVDNPRLNLYINVNDICNAQCSFCNVHKTPSSNEKIDYAKLKRVIEELYYKEILNWISFTGGETFLAIDSINKILDIIYTLDPNILVSINTNGTLLDRIGKIEALDNLNEIHISRHHYDDETNNQIFNVKTATTQELTDLGKRLRSNQLCLNCNMIKGFIDNPIDARKYLEFSGAINAYKMVFVSLMELNEFCKENFIHFSELGLLKSSLVTEELFDNDYCECKHLVHITDEGKPVYYYYRRSVKNKAPDYCRQLVYTANNKLLTGFGKAQIY